MESHDDRPPEYEYLDEPGRICLKLDGDKRTGEVKYSVLTADQMAHIAAAWRKIFSNRQAYSLKKWIANAQASARHATTDLSPFASHVVALCMVGEVLAQDGVEPFKSLGPVVKFGGRRPWKGQPMPCQATRTAPAECVIDSKYPGHPFILSAEAADRLESLSLSPLEYFRLKALHGSSHFQLHYDFYGEEGEAYQPHARVNSSRSQRYPTLKQAKRTLDDLLDYCFCCVDENAFRQATAHLKEFDRVELDAALAARLGNPPHPFRSEKCWDVRIALDMVDAPTLRSRWTTVKIDEVVSLAKDSVPITGSAATIDAVLEAVARLRWPDNPPADQPPSYFMLPSDLAMGLEDRMGAPMLLELVLELMNRLPPKHWAGHFPDAACEVLQALTVFSDDRVLQWLEEHCREPVTYEWGTAAAVNCLDWPRVARWLNAGRPLSLMALDAVANCRPFDPQDKERSGKFQTQHPKIAGGPSHDEILAVLRAHAKRDPDPQIARRVNLIEPHIAYIFR